MNVHRNMYIQILYNTYDEVKNKRIYMLHLHQEFFGESKFLTITYNKFIMLIVVLIKINIKVNKTVMKIL